MQMTRLNTPKVAPNFGPRPRPVRRPAPVRASMDWQEGVALAGKGLGLFVLFTSTMNWWFYKRTREEAEKKSKK
jgi:hypothetical protein